MLRNSIDDKPPKKPAISSSLGANLEFENWLAANKYHEITDSEGLKWELKLRLHSVPHPSEPKGEQVELTMELHSQASAKEFVEHGTLKLEEDQRLVDLLGEDTLPLVVKPKKSIFPHHESIKQDLAETIQELTSKFLKSNIRSIKRNLIGKWINDKAKFKSRV